MADDPYKAPEARVDDSGATAAGPAGLGGWLILVAFGLAVTAVRLTIFVLTTLMPVFTGPQWAELTTPGAPAYHPMWAPVLIGETVGNVFFVALAAALLVLFFRKSPLFPKVFIAYMVLNVVFVTGDFFLANMIPAVAAMDDKSTIAELARAGVGAAIWVPYMLVSKRVKNTFLRPQMSRSPAVTSAP